MPVIFSIQGNEYQYPEGWQDVTLAKWLDSVERLKKPDVLTNLHRLESAEARRAYVEKEITPDVYTSIIVPYFVEYCAFWCSVPSELLYKIHIDKLEALYQQIETNLNRSLAKCTQYVPYIEYKGETWYLPEQHLKNGLVGEFIEAAQAEHLAKTLQGNQMRAIPKLLCIFLKKSPKATYDPRQLQREPYFLEMPMDNVFRVSFFLSRLNERLVRNFHIYTAASHLAQLQHNKPQA